MIFKFSLFFALVVICSAVPVNIQSSEKPNDESVLDTVSDFSLALVQALTKAFKRYLPKDLARFIHTLTNKDLKTMQAIWEEYANDKRASYEDILAKINELNPGLMARIKKFYHRIAMKIVKLPKEARAFAIKSILKFDPLLAENANENYIISAMVEVYRDYQKLPQKAKDAIVEQFPFVGEVIRARLFEEYVLQETNAPTENDQHLIKA